jgi:hypothetical protein
VRVAFGDGGLASAPAFIARVVTGYGGQQLTRQFAFTSRH